MSPLRGQPHSPHRLPDSTRTTCASDLQTGRFASAPLIIHPVSKLTRHPQTPGAKPAEPPYEDALRRLETIVDEMENGDLPLESLLARFEEGTRLAQLCQTRLAEAELKVQQLEQTPDGTLTAKPVAPPPSPDP
jgi:exodeoxyribonuclease VII small subunit